jgi:hypothetical protein
MNSLLVSFNDKTWTVRDVACLACGHYLATYQDECKDKYEDLCHLWFSYLSDSVSTIGSVAASAIVTVLKDAFQEDLTPKVTTYIE